MNELSCPVVRDLLPLYGEGLCEQETASLVSAHLETCADCRAALRAVRAPAELPADGAAPLRSLKKDLRQRRLRAAAIAALAVFLPLYLLLVRALAPIYYFGYTEALVTVSQRADGVPEIRWSDLVSGLETERVTMEDGSETLYLQPYTTLRDLRLSGTEASRGGVLVPEPAPDRICYGFTGAQTLLWGTPAGEGVVILPRLVLQYYAAMAAVTAAVTGILWLVLRKKRVAGTLRQIFFAPLSYALADFLVRVFCRAGSFALVGGAGTSAALPMGHLSFSAARDLGEILLAAAAIYALMTLVWFALRSRRRERPGA